MNAEVDKSDLVVAAAAVLAILITVLSVMWLFNAPVIADEMGKTRFDAYQSIFKAVVHDTLLSLFTTIVGLKVGFVALRYLAFQLGRSKT
jgi:hypothetical protein